MGKLGHTPTSFQVTYPWGHRQGRQGNAAPCPLHPPSPCCRSSQWALSVRPQGQAGHTAHRWSKPGDRTTAAAVCGSARAIGFVTMCVESARQTVQDTPHCRPPTHRFRPPVVVSHHRFHVFQRVHLALVAAPDGHARSDLVLQPPTACKRGMQCRSLAATSSTAVARLAKWCTTFAGRAHIHTWCSGPLCRAGGFAQLRPPQPKSWRSTFPTQTMASANWLAQIATAICSPAAAHLIWPSYLTGSSLCMDSIMSG